MKTSTSIASHLTSNDPGPAVATGPGASFAQDSWHIGKMDGSLARKEKEADYIINELESGLASETVATSEAERKANLKEQIKKRGLRYEELSGTPKKFNTFLKIQDVSRWRNIDCEHYNDCLGYAAFRNWPSFICTGCTYCQI